MLSRARAYKGGPRSRYRSNEAPRRAGAWCGTRDPPRPPPGSIRGAVIISGAPVGRTWGDTPFHVPRLRHLSRDFVGVIRFGFVFVLERRELLGT
ncbi:hypothetical protein GWI33_020153 [Rhynchophorus ferrugineus]|uniref:Uncharacterized protein n=1 Tax=Rhynchophorus ferrugineus TaxID=354439 RepID=A0A834HRT1_RHYFE|nr:hypothetical protein GWI33_020153 [Rhynchophorus ferrugineus]